MELLMGMNGCQNERPISMPENGRKQLPLRLQSGGVKHSQNNCHGLSQSVRKNFNSMNKNRNMDKKFNNYKHTLVRLNLYFSCSDMTLHVIHRFICSWHHSVYITIACHPLQAIEIVSLYRYFEQRCECSSYFRPSY